MGVRWVMAWCRSNDGVRAHSLWVTLKVFERPERADVPFGDGSKSHGFFHVGEDLGEERATHFMGLYGTVRVHPGPNRYDVDTEIGGESSAIITSDMTWLVVWLPFLAFSHILGNVLIPIDEL